MCLVEPEDFIILSLGGHSIGNGARLFSVQIIELSSQRVLPAADPARKLAIWCHHIHADHALAAA